MDIEDVRLQALRYVSAGEDCTVTMMVAKRRPIAEVLRDASIVAAFLLYGTVPPVRPSPKSKRR